MAPFRTENTKKGNGLLKTELAIEHLRFSYIESKCLYNVRKSGYGAHFLNSLSKTILEGARS